MSYNIDTWKTKTLQDFKIPLKVVQALPGVEVKANPLSSVWAALACRDFQRPAGCLVGR
jgi:hypothetical protein